MLEGKIREVVCCKVNSEQMRCGRIHVISNEVGTMKVETTLRLRLRLRMRMRMRMRMKRSMRMRMRTRVRMRMSVT